MFCFSPSPVTGVLGSSSAVVPTDPVPVLQTKFLAWPGTCHNNMNMSGGLGPWVKPVTVAASALLTLQRGCGTGLWLRLLPCHLNYCSWFLPLCPLGSSNPLLLFDVPNLNHFEKNKLFLATRITGTRTRTLLLCGFASTRQAFLNHLWSQSICVMQDNCTAFSFCLCMKIC